jgi:hypothetical protein
MQPPVAQNILLLHCENACNVERNRMFNVLLDAHWHGPGTSSAQETLDPMLQSVAEACLDEVKAGVSAPWEAISLSVG